MGVGSVEGTTVDTRLGSLLGLGEGMALLCNEGTVDGFPEGPVVELEMGISLGS